MKLPAGGSWRLPIRSWAPRGLQGPQVLAWLAGQEARTLREHARRRIKGHYQEGKQKRITALFRLRRTFMSVTKWQTRWKEGTDDCQPAITLPYLTAIKWAGGSKR